jgi:hypothetical protein
MVLKGTWYAPSACYSPLAPYFLVLLDVEREICYGDIYFTGVWRGLKVEDEVWLFLRSVCCLPLPWRISRSFWELPCLFSPTFCDGPVLTQHAFDAVVPSWVTLLDGVGF